MSKEEKIEWLLRYSDEVKKLDHLREEYTDLQDIRLHSPSFGYSGSRQQESKVERDILKMEKYEKLIVDQMKKAFLIRSEIVETIDCMNDELQSCILSCRFICRLSWDQIADALELSADHCRGYLYRKAIENFTISQE